MRLSWRGPLRAGLAALFFLGSPARARADVPIPKTPIGFSKLVVRVEGTDSIGIAGADFHVRLIERMRSAGFAAVGAENLVFGKDESRRAEYLVGGTVREIACTDGPTKLSCRAGVEWQVLDVAKDDVVYTVITRVAVLDEAKDKGHMAALLLDRSLDSLLRRDRFRSAIASREGEGTEGPKFAEASLPKCPAGRSVTENADDLLREVVVVKTRDGFGSGFFVSPEGLVLTAAHVVDGPTMKLRLRDGTDLDAVPVRVSTRDDVALLRTVKPLSAQRCAPLRLDAPASGVDVFAAGAPASLDLAFSLTRGIVSGMPTIDGQRRLQTDAPVNPGNSGGPIVDGSGAALGIVSFKIVSAKIEGVAFAVPTPEALRALGLRLGDDTDPRLLGETASLKEEPKVVAFKDESDGVPSLDPEGDRVRAEIAERRRARAREAEARAEAVEDQRRRTPVYVPALRWGGVGAGLLGLAAAGITYSQYQAGTTTQVELSHLRTENTIAWTVAGLGLGAFVVSFVLEPPLRKPASAGATATTLGVGPGGVSLQGGF